MLQTEEAVHSHVTMTETQRAFAACIFTVISRYLAPAPKEP